MESHQEVREGTKDAFWHYNPFVVHRVANEIDYCFAKKGCFSSTKHTKNAKFSCFSCRSWKKEINPI